MRIINPNSSFTWSRPLDIHGVPMLGIREKQGVAFSRYGWIHSSLKETADECGKRHRQSLRPVSSHYLQIARHDYAGKHVVPFPRYFIIEPTNICNRACPFCPIDIVDRRNLDGSVMKGHMKWSHFYTLMDECSQHDVYGLSLYQLGEAMLWKDQEGTRTIADMVRTAKTVGGFRAVNISTNGDVNNLHLLLECPLDDLIISIDGTTQDVYDENRPSTRKNDVGAFTRTVQRVKEFLHEKTQRNLTTPYVRLQIINKGNTKDQILDFIKYWITVPGVDDVFVKNLDGMEPWVGNRALSEEESSAKMQQVSHMPCQHLWAIGSMTASGTFNACCHDARTELTSNDGDHVELTSFAEWWRGDFMTQLRGEHVAGATRLPCSACRERDPWLG